MSGHLLLCQIFFLTKFLNSLTYEQFSHLYFLHNALNFYAYLYLNVQMAVHSPYTLISYI